MRSQTAEASQTAVKVYLILVTLVLPLYMRDGYGMIGDTKYHFFHNITLLFMVVLTVLSAARMVLKTGEKRNRSLFSNFSGTDAVAVCFLAGAVVSCLLSPDPYTARYGFPGWYMGLWSQLMFVWIYFAVSRLYDGSPGVLWAYWAGAVAVMALGILNCYNFDPLALFQGLDNWNNGHLLSTIGNKNWYCGYVSAASAVCFYFGYHQDKRFRAAGYAGCFLFFWTILTQGSEGGYLIVTAAMLVLGVWSLEDRKKLISFLSIAICCPLAGLLGQYCIRFRGLVLVEDGMLRGLLFWKGWLPVASLLMALTSFLYWREKQGYKDILREKRVRKFMAPLVGMIVAAAFFVFVLCQVSEEVWKWLGEKEFLRITDTWGNDRGKIWRLGVNCFFKGSAVNKLFGIGSDCFYYAAMKYDPVNAVVNTAGQWENAVYANAHNEWLNMLVNQGLFGLAAYAGIFITQFVRLWRHSGKESEALLGLMAISGYCAYGTVSFQQVTSTPLLFAVLGISEALVRRGEHERMQGKN